MHHLRTLALLGLFWVAGQCQVIIAGNTTQNFRADVAQSASCISTMSVTRSPTAGDYTASLQNLGCFRLTVDPRFDSAAVPTQQFGAYTSTDRSIMQCAAFCELEIAQGMLNLTQFAFTNGTCFCLASVNVVRASSATSDQCCSGNATCTSGIYLTVWQLDVSCPLTSTACGDSCQSVKGCCLPTTAATADVSSQLLLLQTALGIAFLVAGAYFGFQIACRRRRVQEDDNDDDHSPGSHERRFVLPGGDLDEAIVMIGISSLPLVSACCADLFPDAQGLADDATCCVCLEPLSSNAESDAIETPCKHAFHRECMLDFISHKLRTSLEDLTCPMCRAVIICQILDEDSELGRLRRSLFEMRNGRRRPVTPPSGSSPSRRAPAMEEAQALLEMTPSRREERSAMFADDRTEPLIQLGPSEPTLMRDLGPVVVVINETTNGSFSELERSFQQQAQPTNQFADPTWAAL